MTHIIEDRPGETLVMTGSDCDLSIDSRRAEFVFERHTMLGRSRRRVVRLDALVDLRLRASERPALTFGVVGKLLGAASDAVSDGQDLDADRTLTSSPRQLMLRTRSRNDDGSIKSVEERLCVDGVVDSASSIELAQKMSAASGLRAVERYVLPECGIEVQLKGGTGASDAASALLPEDLSGLPPPPFDSSEFDGDHRIEEWSPGETVRLRKPLSMLALPLISLSLLLLAGSVLALINAVTGDPSSRGAFLIITAFGLICGGGAAFVVLWSLLPRVVALDWGAREVRVQTWFSRSVVPFAEIARLELEPTVTQAGDGGATKFMAGLRLFRRDQTGDNPAALEIVETKSLPNRDDPLWMALPLLYELSSALKVEARFVN